MYAIQAAASVDVVLLAAVALAACSMGDGPARAAGTSRGHDDIMAKG